MTSSTDLEPPDPFRCQADITPAHNFMTFGPRPRPRRCDNVPTSIAREKERGADGRRGSMSLCDDCRAVFEKKMPDYATFTPIPPTHNLD